MLFETYDLPFSAQTAQILLGLLVGLAFGAAAQISRFCLRRAVVVADDTKQARGVWLTALLFALVATQSLVALGYIDFADHRFMASDMPIAAILIGGLAFGAGMVLTRGCISRLTVLSGTGNMRALVVLMLFSLIAHATLKGVFAPIRTTLGAITTDIGVVSFADLAGGPTVWLALGAIALAAVIWSSKPRPRDAALAAVIGLLVTFGWLGTGFLLFDEFEPMPIQSLAFTSPWADTLFWFIASSSIPAGFGVGLVGGVILGSFLSAAARRELSLTGFENGSQMLRYGSGAGLMGFGGVLAGGCSVGAGLSGVSTLSFAALLALLAIVVGAKLTDIALNNASATAPKSA